MTDIKCPICLWEASSEGHLSSGDGHAGEKFDCLRCGPFFVSRELHADLAHWLHREGEDTKRALLSHAVRKMQRENDPPFLTTYIVEEILKGSLPSPFQQADNLVRWLGTHLKGAGERLSIDSTTHQSIVNSRTPTGFDFVLENPRGNGGRALTLLLGPGALRVSGGGFAGMHSLLSSLPFSPSPIDKARGMGPPKSSPPQIRRSSIRGSMDTSEYALTLPTAHFLSARSSMLSSGHVPVLSFAGSVLMLLRMPTPSSTYFARVSDSLIALAKV